MKYKSSNNIINPKKPIEEIIKQLADDKALITQKLKDGKKEELKGKFKFFKGKS